jgi:hypothetical protein
LLDPDPDPGGEKMTYKYRKSEVLDVLFLGLKASPATCASFMDA